MKLLTLTPLTVVLLASALHPRPARAQDSPIIIDDNGNVPLESKKTAKPTKNAITATNPAPGTHIKDTAGMTRANPGGHEWKVDTNGYQAVCLDTPNDGTIYLQHETPWTITFQSSASGDQTVIKTTGTNNQHIHIQPGPNATDPPGNSTVNLFDSGTNQQLSGATFNGAHTSSKPLSYVQNQDPPQLFTIHYCGPTGCGTACPNIPAGGKKK